METAAGTKFGSSGYQFTMLARFVLTALCLFALFSAGCKRSFSATGNYSMETLTDAGKALLPGAGSLELTLSPGGQLSLDSGRVNILSGQWKENGDAVAFSRSQGMIVSDYKLVDGNLIPYANGMENKNWRFKRKVTSP